jgi:hypothetical protein
MDSFLSLQNSLAGILILGFFHLVLMLAKFFWGLRKAKEDTSEETLKYNTQAVQNLPMSLEKLKDQISALPKMQKDLKRSFVGIKIIAGNDWPRIRKEIEEEENLNG